MGMEFCNRLRMTVREFTEEVCDRGELIMCGKETYAHTVCFRQLARTYLFDK